MLMEFRYDFIWRVLPADTCSSWYKSPMELNCSKLVPDWSSAERGLIFELLQHTDDPVYINIGVEEDHGRLFFVDAGLIRDLLRKVIDHPRKKPSRITIWATDEEIVICSDLLHKVNKHIIKTGFKRMVGMK